MRKTIRLLLVMGLIFLLAPMAQIKAQGSIDGYFSSGGTSVSGSSGLMGSIGEPVVGLFKQDWQHLLQGFAYKGLPLDFTTSTNELLNLAVHVKLFPNPVDQFLNIKFEGVMTGNEKYLICDDGGRLVRTGMLIDPTTQLNVEALRPGAYIFFLINKSTNDRLKHYKFVKIK